MVEPVQIRLVVGNPFLDCLPGWLDGLHGLDVEGWWGWHNRLVGERLAVAGLENDKAWNNTHMLEMREQRELKRFFGQVEKHDLIILDELGYVPFTKLGAELLFEIVIRSYERLSLIVTTNLPFEQWTKVMGSERLTGALLDRLTHRVHIIKANGESYRLKDARKRRKKPREG